ncbi:MAG TPA: exopolysaccharide transport family protein [Xanthobacteraceae bacterium]|nr:exopolysaccharide transport family protein [Xanthobacteraceae bacterium]
MSVASSSRASSPFIDAEFDLPALGAALWRSKWKILRPTLFIALATLAVVQVIPPKYQSEARVLVEGRDNVFLRPDADKDVIDRNAVDEVAVTSQAQLVLSRDLAQDVIAKLRLGERPEFDPALKGVSSFKAVLGRLGLIKDPLRMTPQERVLEAYYDRLTVYPVEKSRVIVIQFLSEDPKLAAAVANAIAEAYLVRQRAAKQDQARAAVQWLSGEIANMQKKVADAEAKVAAFRADTNLLEGPNNTTLSAQQLGDYSAQLAAARAQKVDAEAKAKIIHEMLHSKQPIEASDIINSELMRRLSEQRVTLRAQLAEQSSSLMDGHPRIKELKAQIADLDGQLRAEAERVARSFENDAKIAAARVDSLMTNFDQVKNQAANTNERDVQLRALQRDAKSQRDLLESYLAKYSEATARETLNSSPADARVISRATVSNVPAYPKKLPSVLIATVATLMLACGFVLTKELLSAPGTAAAVMPAPRVVPAAAASQPDAAEAPSEDRLRFVTGAPRDGVADVAQRLRGEGNGRIAVLAANAALDTGEAAVKLARALGKNARVVLAGLDPTDAALKAVSGDPAAPGLAELADGSASFRDIIGKDRLSSVHVISCGGEPTQRIALLSSPRLAPSIEALARSYDYVVLDAGLAEGADLEAIAEIAPRAVLLADDMGHEAAEAARERLVAAEFADVIELASGARMVSAEAA